MPAPLPQEAHRVLLALDYDAYTAVRDIGAHLWPSLPQRKASGTARTWMEDLERRGLVERLNDGGRPVVWRRTAAGTAEIEVGDG